jgi:hypothetical protein
MQNVSARTLEHLRTSRRELEVDVARTIGEYMVANRAALGLGPRIVQMIDMLLELAVGPRAGGADLLLKAQTSYAMWSRCGQQPGLAGLTAIRAFVAGGPATLNWLIVCSDIIRLFGEMSENSWARMMWAEDLPMRDKDRLRPEPIYAKPNAEGWGHRDRADRGAAAVIDAPFIQLPRHAVKWRGVEKFQFGPHSIIDTIDYTFGLPIEGGDVSGTTTDSIAALRWTGGGVDPLVQLIAIATMVSQGHHTTVECAWPLTRHGYIDYVIGFYETLVPPGTHPGLRDTLNGFNADPRNQHLLVCSDLNLLFEKPDEVQAYRKVAGVRKAYAFCSGGKTNTTGLKNMLQANGVANLVIDRISYWL